MITNIPLIGTLYQWWCDHAEKQELIAINSTFEQFLQKPEIAVTPLIHKTIELLQQPPLPPVVADRVCVAI